MKKLLLFAAILLSKFSFGQSISIDPSTSKISCAGKSITVDFLTSGGAIGPFTLDLIKHEYNTPRSYAHTGNCGSSIYTSVLNTSTTSNTASMIVPSNTETIFDPDYPCGYGGSYPYYYGVYANRYVNYYLKVTGGNAVSALYPIHLSSSCVPIMGANMSPSAICAGKTGLVTWLSEGANSGNVFTVELSNSSGTFTSPINLGTLTGNNSNSLKTQTVTVPANTTSGSGYLIKVKSSDPISEKIFSFTVNNTSICGPIQAVIVPTLPLCSGAISSVSYTIDDAFQPGNVFTAELSNNSGSFANPTTIGSISSQTATSIPITLPSDLPYGSYYIRVTASLPSSGTLYTSPNSNSFLVGIPTPQFLNSTYNFCEFAKFSTSIYSSSYQPESAYTFSWKKDGNDVNSSNQSTEINSNYKYFQRESGQSSDAGIYSIVVTRNSDGCAATSTSNTTATFNAAPAAPSTSPVTVVSGNTASLTATSCTGTIYWYKTLLPSSNDYITSGTYTTPELTQQTTYYASCYNNSCFSLRTPLVVSINATNAPSPPIITASNNDFCAGSVSSPKLIATGCTGIVRWYFKYSLTDLSFNLVETDNSTPYEYNISNGTTRIYAADCRENGVLSTTKSETTITVKSVPSSPSLDPNYQTINSGSDVLHNIYNNNNNCAGGTLKWYDASTAGNLLFTGNTYSQTNVTTAYNIYASCTMNGCESSRSGGSVSIQSGSVVYPSFYSNSAEICGSGTAIITALGCTQGTVNWFTYANSIYTNIGTGQAYTTPTLTYSGSNSSVSFQYYADCTIGGTTSSKSYKYINVYKAITTPGANQPTIACNAVATLTVTNCSSSNNFYPRWYESANATNYLSSNTAFTTPNLSATTIYYLECYNSSSSNCKSARIPITVTVGCTPPAAPIISSSTITECAGIGINLTATGCANTINWSDGGIGSSRNNVIFNGSLTLTATCNNGLASSNSNSIAITINPKPALVITNPAAVSPPNTVDITLSSVTAGSTLNGATLSYHTDASGSESLTSPSANAINVSGTYYIKATTSESCIDIKPVIVVISNCETAIVLQSFGNDFNTGTHLKKTNETITASNIISGSANVTYRSNKSILLSPQTNAGFKVEPGSVFKAEIGGCN